MAGDRRRHSVGGEKYNGSRRYIVQLFNEHGSFRFKRANHLEVMHDCSPNEDGRTMLCESIAHCINRSPDSRAKASRRRQDHL